MKRTSASDSLRPGQLNRLIDKIKDCPIEHNQTTKEEEMNRNWKVVVDVHDCPFYHYACGEHHCVQFGGPQYCNEADCPIKPKKGETIETIQRKQKQSSL